MKRWHASWTRAIAFAALLSLLLPVNVVAQDDIIPAAPAGGEQIYLPMVISPDGLAASAAAAAPSDLILTGVVDGPLSGGLPKAVELFALSDIPNLSIYGVGSANNGGGTDGEEFTFPPDSIAAGSFIYVATESTGFSDFFGFAPDYTSGAASINGDDAIELFMNGSVVDVFGEINVDGTGQPWEHTDGWAYRNNGTGPDGSTFILGNWSFSGRDALDGAATNAAAATPFPIGTYSPTATETAPAVASTTPANGASNVAVDTTITINFSEDVDLASSAVTLECPAGSAISFASLPEIPASGTSGVTLTPNADLPAGATCEVEVIAAQVTDSDIDDPPDNMANDYAFSFSTATSASGWIINEFQANPDAGQGDANGDGTVDTSEDEFVEIVNNTGAPVDISGWTLSDGAGVRHTFPAGTVVADQCAVVVFGGGTPTGGFGGATVQTASTNFLGLNNGGDAVTLNDGVGDVASETYGSEGGDNQSLTRDPDIAGPFVKHTTTSAGTRFSPGVQLDGAAFAGCPPPQVKIHDIQGAGASVVSPGATVTVEAVVVGDYQADDQLDGFFIQEEDGDVDGDPATSEGIFVFCGACATAVNVGDLVTITGIQEEYFGMSQIDAGGAGAAVAVVSSGNALPAPASVNLPLDETQYEPYEGMLVNFPQTLTVSEYFELARYGQIVLTQGGRTEQFTNANAPDAAGYAAHLAAKAARTVILDDDNNRQNDSLDFSLPYDDDKAVYHPAPGGFSTTNFVRGGDTIDNLTGVLHWSWAGQSGTEAWRIRPVPEAYGYAFNAANPRPGVPAVGGNVKVASLNVLNFFTTLDNDSAVCGPGGNLNCRGANSAAEYTRQLDKLVTALQAIDADVVGLVELENNAAANPAGDGVDPVLEALVDGLNAASSGAAVSSAAANIFATGYSFIDAGVLGTDAIKVGLIYKTATVEPVGAAAVLDSDAFVRPNTPDPKNRPALAQTFRVIDGGNAGRGEAFAVVVNHLKSKGSACDTAVNLGDDDPDTGQGNCNGTRTAAAQALTNWLATDASFGGDTDVLIIGDLNAYAKEDPIAAIVNASYTDLIDQFTGGDAYSFVFDGEIGYLDHALANAALAPQIAGAAVWHINADEVNLLDYNDPVLDTGEANFERKTTVNTLYAADEFRSSDHDPVLVGLNLLPNDDNLPASYGEAPHNRTNDTLYLGNNWGGAADGVAQVPAYAGGGVYSLEVTVNNSGTLPAQLVAWVDFDGSGTFEASERSLPSLAQPLPSGCDSAGAIDATFTTGNIPAGCQGMVTLQWAGVSGGAAQLYGRVRLTTEPSFFSDSSPTPAGLARDGESEGFGTVPLAVTLGYITAERSGETVDFFWQTATERGVAGFDLLVELSGGLIRLNEELVASQAIDSATPTDYAFSAATAASVYYLEQIALDGQRTRFGPYEVGVEYGSYVGANDVAPSVYLPLMRR